MSQTRLRAYGIVGAIYGGGLLGLGGVSLALWETFHSVQDAVPFGQRHFTTFHPTPLRLIETKEEAHNILRLKFATPNAYDRLGNTVCSVQLSVPGTPRVMSRWYTPLNPQDQPGELDFLVKCYVNGKMSMILKNLRVGDVIEMRAALQEFQYKPNKVREVGMIAAGTGISPMYQLLVNALNDPSDTTKFRLLFSNPTEGHTALRNELDALAIKYPDRFTLTYNLTNFDHLRKPSGKLNNTTFGWIDKETIKKTMPPPGQDTQLLICGPNQLLTNLCGRSYAMFRMFRHVYPIEYFQGWYTGILRDLGYPRNRVYKFGSTEEYVVISL